MRVVGFVGESGSGKSYRAMWIAKQNNIKYIIDDGLFINSKRVLAGFSAKKEDTKLASIKRALFVKKDHIAEVKNAIVQHNPDSILILGTSVGMVERIIEALDLPKLDKIIRIEEIATKEEIDHAKKVRKEQGKHVIPVPTFEIKQDFSGYFIDSLRVFLGYGKGSKKEIFSAEKTVVRPTFSYLGEFHISNHVLASLCKFEAERIEGVYRLLKTTVKSTSVGVILNCEISAFMQKGKNLNHIARNVQISIKNSIEEYTAINVNQINITIRSLEV